MKFPFQPLRTCLLALSLAIGLSGVAPSVAQTTGFTTPLVKDAYVIEIPFKPYGSMYYAITIREVQGKVAVCGIWAEGDRWQAYVIKGHLPMRVRGVTTVMLGDTYLLKGVGFFTQGEMEDFVSGTPVNCQMTNVPWQRGYSNKMINLRIPRLRVIA